MTNDIRRVSSQSAMNLRQVLRDALQQLAAAQVPSASTTAEVLLMHVLERDRTFLYAYPEAELSVEQERAYRHLLRQRAAGHPTQYLTCRQEFWGLPLHVEPGVFIPRPETEHVVEVALQIVRERMSKADARIVDVGTGTGCIALALAKDLPEAHITAVDVSEDALRLARHNAEALGLAQRVQFLHSDLLDVFTSHEPVPLALFIPSAVEGSEAEGSGVEGSRACPERSRGVTSLSRAQSRDHESRPFDLIVSNPPYVSPDQAAQVPREVREHEPPAALFSPGDGLEVTRRLIDQAAILLAPSASSDLPGALVGQGFSPAEKWQRQSG
ncbi:MAG: class I SAM-dependent methyltransferase, partial [Candidatus Acidiferrales bacterium]